MQLVKPDPFPLVTPSRLSAPRVSQIQVEVESGKPRGAMRMLLENYKIKR